MTSDRSIDREERADGRTASPRSQAPTPDRSPDPLDIDPAAARQQTKQLILAWQMTAGNSAVSQALIARPSPVAADLGVRLEQVVAPPETDADNPARQVADAELSDASAGPAVTPENDEAAPEQLLASSSPEDTTGPEPIVATDEPEGTLVSAPSPPEQTDQTEQTEQTEQTGPTEQTEQTEPEAADSAAPPPPLVPAPTVAPGFVEPNRPDGPLPAPGPAPAPRSGEPPLQRRRPVTGPSRTRPPTPGGRSGRSTGDRTLDSWRSAARSAIAETPAGDLSQVAEAPSELRAVSGDIDSGRRAGRQDYRSDARSAQPPMPAEEPKPQSLDTTAADEAVAAVRAAGEQRLTSQTFSAIGTPPPYPGLDPGDYVPATERRAITDLEARLDGMDLSPAERASLTRQLEAAKARVAAIEETAAAGTPVAEPPTVVDEGAAPLEPPGREQVDLLGDAIARALGMVEPGADAIVMRAVGALHGENVARMLEQATAEKEAVRAELEAELRGIAEVAGVTENELLSKIEQQSAAVRSEEATIEADLQTSGTAAIGQVEQRAGEEIEEIAGARSAVDSENQARQEAVAEPADTAAIERTREEYLGRIVSVGAQAKAAVRAAATTRSTDLTASADDYKRAAQQAAAGQAAAIRRHWATDEDADKGTTEARPTVSWGSARAAAIEGERRALDAAARAEADRLTQTIEGQIEASREVVRDWAAAAEGTERSWWDRLVSRVADWHSQASADNEAWERQRNAESRERMAEDFSSLTALREALAEGNRRAATDELAAMDARQQELANRYLQGGVDSIGFVAESTVNRIGDRRVPEIATRMEEEAIANWSWEELGQLARATNDTFQPLVLADKIRGAISGVGTDEAAVYEGLGGARTAVERAALAKCYEATFHVAMDEDVRDDMEDHELERAEALMSGRAAEADAAAIREAVSGLGTDEEAVRQALRGRTPEQIEQIKAEYERLYHVTLGTDLQDDLSGAELDNALALTTGDSDAADAAELEIAMEGMGTDEAGLRKVFERVRQEEEARARRDNLTPSELQANIEARNARLAAAYNERYGDLTTNMTAELADVDESAVGRLQEEGSPLVNSADIRLMQALQRGDPAEIDAMRALREHEGVYADDDEIESVVRNQRARADLDVSLELTAERARLRAQFEAGDLTVEEFRAQEADWQSRWTGRDEAIRRRSRENVAELRSRYSDATGGRQSFDELVNEETSGYSRLEIEDLVVAGGALSADQEIYYATAGGGTDEEMIRRQLQGRTPQQIDELRTAYEWSHGEGSFDADILGDLSGREDLDIGHILRYGDPSTFARQLAEARTPAERQRILDNMRTVLRERQSFEETGMIGALFAAGADPMESAAQMEQALRRAEEYDAALAANEEATRGRDPSEVEPDPALAAARANLEMNYAGAIEAQQQVRARIDAYADVAAQVGAAAVALAVTVATVGTAGPAVAALYAAAAAAAATMALKAQLRGAAYSWEEAGVDAAVGVVDAGVSALTAGIGGRVIDGIEAAVRATIARRAAQEGVEELTEAAARSLLRETLAEGIEGGVGAMPSAMVQALLDDATWSSDDPWAVVMAAGGQGGLMGAGMGVGFHLGGEVVRAIDPVRVGGEAPAGAGGGEPGRRSVELRLPSEADPDLIAARVEAGEAPPGGPERRPRLPDEEGVAGRDGGVDDRPTTEIPAAAAREPVVGDDGLIDLDHPANRWILENGFAGRPPDELATDPVAAQELFDGFVRSQPEIEAALLRNSQTGEFIVVQGDSGSVDIREGHGVWEGLVPRDQVGVGRWELVVHSHPIDGGSGVTPTWARMPSGAEGDFGWSVWESSHSGQPVQHEIRITTETGADVTRYGYDPGAERPYSIDFPTADGGRAVETFATIEEYHAWYQREHGGDLGQVPDGFAGRRETAEPAPQPPEHVPQAPGRAGGEGADSSAQASSSTGMSNELLVGRDGMRQLFDREPDLQRRLDEAVDRLDTITGGLSAEDRRQLAGLFAPTGDDGAISAKRLRDGVEMLERLVDHHATNPDLFFTRARQQRQLESLKEQARAIDQSYRDGVTDERPSEHGRRRVAATPELDAELNRMRDAVRDLGDLTDDPIANLVRLERLQTEVARGSEVLRSGGESLWRITDRLDVLPTDLDLRHVGEDLGDLDVATATESEVLAATELYDVDVTAAGRLGEPLARDLPGVGLERHLRTPAEIGRLPTDPPELAARMAAMLSGYHRAHMVGPGFGDELFAGIMLAPADFNLHTQNEGVEWVLRALHARGEDPQVTISAEGTRHVLPLRGGGYEHVDVLQKITYEIRRHDGEPLIVSYAIAPPPQGTIEIVRSDIAALGVNGIEEP